jgi:O-methyltransferase
MTTAANTRRTATARDVLGVPVLPPGAVTAGASRVRSALGRLHAAMAPPPLRILEGLFGMLDHRVLVALCDAGVPDALTAPTDIGPLADRLDADAATLERLLRFAATRGWVRIDRRGRVRPTRLTAFLRRDHPGGWRAWVDFAGGDEVVSAVRALSPTAGTDGFAAANGAPFFEWMADHPDRWATFDRAMAAGGRMHALGLATTIDWTGTGTVCDVGGGTGELLATLLDLVPDLRGTVLDLPTVVARAVDHPRLTVVGGDAFEQVPAGSDTYLLVNVLHDWDDDDAARLLARVTEAATRDSRVIVVDSEATTVPRDDMAAATDVLMAALTSGGKERDTRMFARLGASAGLRHQRSVRLPSGDLAHIFGCG